MLTWTFFRLPDSLPPENRQPLNWAHIGRCYKTVLTTRVAIGYMLASGIGHWRCQPHKFTDRRAGRHAPHQPYGIAFIYSHVDYQSRRDEIDPAKLLGFPAAFHSGLWMLWDDWREFFVLGVRASR